MNFAFIRYLIGWVLCFEGGAMAIIWLLGLLFGEQAAWSYLACSLLCLIPGFLFSRRRPKNNQFYAKEGFVTVALSWIILSIFGALPFVFSREIPSFTDALFEIISGFTTTGASILSDVEVLSRCNLLWRSFSHWVGGMGVLVFILAILPMAGGQTLYLMRAESPGPSVGKLVPRLQKTAFILYAIYFAMTLLELGCLLVGGMAPFDAVCITFGTAGTGGFGVLNSSIASYGPHLQVIITIFMFLFGVNFNFYYLFLAHKAKDALRMEEVRWYFLIYLVALVMITANLSTLGGHFLENLRQASFQISSIMTTTGFATADFNNWPEFSRAILVSIMFIGACAGSTGGGIKVSRIVMYAKTATQELSQLVHPRSVRTLKMEGKVVDPSVRQTTNTFLIAYIMIFAASFLLICLDNFDLITSFTAVAATLNNIGPGLEVVGPTGNYSAFSLFSKYVLMFDMLAGRLEIFPMLLLFAPKTWRRQ